VTEVYILIGMGWAAITLAFTRAPLPYSWIGAVIALALMIVTWPMFVALAFAAAWVRVKGRKA